PPLEKESADLDPGLALVSRNVGRGDVPHEEVLQEGRDVEIPPLSQPHRIEQNREGELLVRAPRHQQASAPDEEVEIRMTAGRRRAGRSVEVGLEPRLELGTDPESEIFRPEVY